MQRRSLAEILAGAVVLLVALGFLVYAVSNSGRSLASGNGIELTARFDRIDGLQPGADVRIGGVKVGSVTSQEIDPATFLAVLKLRVNDNLKLPTDTSAEITSEGLLGGKYVALVPGGEEKVLASGDQITLTQSSVSLESLLGRFIFSVTQMSSDKPQNESEEAAPAAPAPAR
ncbi:outer membrane lipid asymmetry maintenance protein MlaD [Roseomonas marmotae]|uniref:Outer membrane lipid asymmetry maintenance protein MlaD n=1 Tax=Roseomonas marmotae TaxID=2768161 RepID=A0ABS3KG18_9PROT|nr:outer membrane lipid asymmetry maintenance protein MlaD [Roseomonas marmotae]MBO1076417.1 outer membrane lipid asymmetry maintenance protein MlaD [Roseomonas marmotae]QTI79380.1 outer membrane lipid asymmetry maintenance protein MlaD [Roseomonas marmotae]